MSVKGEAVAQRIIEDFTEVEDSVFEFTMSLRKLLNMISGIKMTCGSVREKFDIVAGYERLIRKKDFKDLF